MRHIPEEELHAYLDQALSRSQCVEIERHLARCSGCQEGRDTIAGLRDRTTELLSRLGPPPIVPPPFEILKLRRTERIRRRWRWVARGAWAASLAGAVAVGWQVDRRLSHEPAPAGLAVAPAVLAALPPAPALESPAAPAPARTRVPTRRAYRPSPDRPVHTLRPSTLAPSIRFAQALDADPDTVYEIRPGTSAARATSPDLPDLLAQPVGGDPGLQGLWRTILPDSAGPSPASDVPLVPGLPVVQLRVQPGNSSSEVTAVDQVLESGEMIRTIAGPAARVGSLVDNDTGVERGFDGTDASGRMTVTIRQGDRMVAVTGPSQAMGSLLSRVNVKRRRY